ncbi:MAG: leucine-rich repeat domain-containing protein [Ruminococcaceae bacterium]|nr:leucine-rich repeat domain-containing protein [Oscillospiraceae bacterium]
MKKLLAVVLVVAMLASLAACKKEKKQTEDLKDYLQSDEVVNFETLKSGETYHFDHIDSETVVITAYECSNEKHKLVIPDTLGGKRVIGIATGAFKANNDITQIIIPDSVETIGKYAFAECALVTDLIVPASVKTIEEGAFANCVSLCNVNIQSTRLEEYADNLFYGCASLTSVSVPDHIKTVGKAAFYGCSGVQEIVIAEGVLVIGAQAFQNCEKLEKLTLPASLTEIGEMAFSGSPLLYADSLTLAEGATVAEAYFAQEIYMLPERPVDEPEDEPEDPEDPEEPEDTTPIGLPDGWVMLDNGVIAFGRPGDWTVSEIADENKVEINDPLAQHKVTLEKLDKNPAYESMTEESFNELLRTTIEGGEVGEIKAVTVERNTNDNGISYTKIAMVFSGTSALKTIIAYTNSVNTYLITVDSTVSMPELVAVIESTLVRTA